MADKTIEHCGIVKQIDNKKIVVTILAQSACAACHAKGACGTAEMENKEIEIYDCNDKYIIGEQVTVFFAQKKGNKAVILGYIMPLIFLIAVMIIVYKITNNQDLSALIALLSLSIYYFVLYLFKNKIKKEFQFSIKKNI